MVWRRLAVLLFAFVFPFALVAGCYRPNIASGGFKCATGNVPCPDGFHCGPDKLCYLGDGGPTCDSPPPTPSCSTGPSGGQACNQNCERGCSCGFCSVANGATVCLTVAAGTSGVGEVCDPRAQAPCQKGLFCRPECNSTDASLGRCYKFCADSSDCQICQGDGSCQNTNCIVNQTSSNPTGGSLSFKLCSLPNQQCDPVGATSGCPATTQDAFACYANDDDTLCDCKGTFAAGPTGCALVGDCIPGYTCVKLSATAPGSCLPTCQVNGDCTLPATCNFLPGDSKYGYCL